MNEWPTEEYTESVEDVAAFWLVRLSSSECTPDDRFAFEMWKRESPENEAVFDRMRRANTAVNRFSVEAEVQDMIELARAETQPRFAQRYGMRLAAVAATVVLLLTGAYLFTLMPWAQPQMAGPVVASVEDYETAIGERSTITLSDGSVLTLNTNSRVEVDYSAQMRRIQLTQGQAFFEVAKDLDRPFAVHAGGKQVVALGTVFDVRFDREDTVQVTLIEGRVQVADLPLPVVPGNDGVSAQRQAAVELKPGERFIGSAGGQVEVSVTDIEAETSWRSGRLVFHEKNLSDVVAEMNRYSTQKLVLDEDARLAEIQVSGVFNTGRTSSFVNALEVLHPLQAVRTGPDQLTLVWQE